MMIVPKWMKITLVVAGIHNFVWGSWTILFPNAMFRLLEMELPIYPQFWQGIGMLVAVYGIAYLIASTDPVRFWPVVLVGLLGKIFGPIGFAVSWLQGALPVTFGMTLIANDLVWWIPFASVLWFVFGEESRPTEIDESFDALRNLTGSSGKSLYDCSFERPLFVLFLRHAGCTFHREALFDLAQQSVQIDKLGLRIALVHMSEESPPKSNRDYGLKDAIYFSDPKGYLYRAFGLDRGKLWQLFGPPVIRRGITAILMGHGFGPIVGDGFQMPGAFVYQRGKVGVRYKHITAADTPNYLELARIAKTNAGLDEEGGPKVMR